MTLRLMLNMAGPPAPPTAFMPLEVLPLISLSVRSVVTGPFVVSIFMPPPEFWVILTWSTVTLMLPPAVGLSSTPAPLLEIRLLVITTLTAAFGSMSNAGPEKLAKTQFSKIRVPLPLIPTLIALVAPPTPLKAILRKVSVRLGPTMLRTGTPATPVQDPAGQSMSNAALLAESEKPCVSATGSRHKIRPLFGTSDANASIKVAQGAAAVHAKPPPVADK